MVISYSDYLTLTIVQMMLTLIMWWYTKISLWS